MRQHNLGKEKLVLWSEASRNISILEDELDVPDELRISLSEQVLHAGALPAVSWDVSAARLTPATAYASIARHRLGEGHERMFGFERRGPLYRQK